MKMNMQPKVYKKDIQSEVPFTWIAENVEAISKSMKLMEQTRLTDKILIALVHDHTGIAKRDIESVIKTLRNMDGLYLKPIPKP